MISYDCNSHKASDEIINNIFIDNMGDTVEEDTLSDFCAGSDSRHFIFS